MRLQPNPKVVRACPGRAGPCRFHVGRSTLYYVKTAAVTIRLDPSLEEMLDRVCRDTGRSRSEVVREALRRQLTLELFQEARRQLIPFAEAQGIYTDEDVFKFVS